MEKFCRYRALASVSMILWLGFAVPVALRAQDPLRFEKEVAAIVEGDSLVKNKKVILFTGSSSIRLWKNVQSYFPNHNVLNRGFGGSEMSDLLFYYNRLVRPYRTRQIFIYEGDNDIASGKTPPRILQDADSLLALIRKTEGKRVHVVFISPKPSIARWDLRDKYTAYNKLLRDWTAQHRRVAFADVWTPMLDANGEPMQDIFIEDGLHLNKKGYDIWSVAIGKFIR